MRDSFRSITKRLEAVVKDTASTTLDKSSSLASSAAKAGRSAMDRTSSALSQSASTAYERSKSKALKTARSASKEISGRVGDTYRKGKSAAYDQVTQASRNAFNKASETISFGRDYSTKVMWWLWWWSLAAIGVYGIATTLPKELVKIAFENSTKKEASDQQEETKPPHNERESKSFWEKTG